MTVKERFKAQSGFLFLRKRFIVTETGKVIIRLHKDALSDERKALRALNEKMLRGEVTMDHIRAHYQSVISYFEYAGDAPIRAMDKFYTELFRERPKYKRKGKMYGNQKN